MENLKLTQATARSNDDAVHDEEANEVEHCDATLPSVGNNSDLEHIVNYFKSRHDNVSIGKIYGIPWIHVTMDADDLLKKCELSSTHIIIVIKCIEVQRTRRLLHQLTNSYYHL